MTIPINHSKHEPWQEEGGECLHFCRHHILQQCGSRPRVRLVVAQRLLDVQHNLNNKRWLCKRELNTINHTKGQENHNLSYVQLY